MKSSFLKVHIPKGQSHSILSREVVRDELDRFQYFEITSLANNLYLLLEFEPFYNPCDGARNIHLQRSQYYISLKQYLVNQAKFLHFF